MNEGPIADGELRSLMTRYQSSDRAALEELVRRLSPPLLRYFGASGIGREDTEDLLQDCWMRIHRARHTYRSSEPVLPWLYAIARHTRLDEYRRRRRRQAREVLVAAVPENLQCAESPAPPETLENEEIGRLLAGLPGSQREVVLMLKVSGMSLQEVARATGSTVGAVKQKAHRAYQALRRALAEGGLQPARGFSLASHRRDASSASQAKACATILPNPTARNVETPGRDSSPARTEVRPPEESSTERENAE